MRGRHTCIITINYNNSNDTLEMLESVIENLYDIEIIIVDNNSCEEDFNHLLNEIRYSYSYVEYKNNCQFNMLKIEKSNITIIRSKYNGGFAYGNNIGINFANLKLVFDYFWFLNNDVILKNNALFSLIEYSKKNNDQVALGSTILEYYTPSIIQCAGGVYFNKYTTHTKYNYKGEKLDFIEKLVEIDDFDFILGCAIFASKEIINKIKGFSTDYFLYFEELDLAQKLKKIKVRQVWVKESCIYHKGGCSIGSKSIVHKKSYISEYHEDKSCLVYLSKHQKKTFLIASVIRYILKVIKKLIAKDINGIKALNSAYSDYFLKKNNK